MVKEDVQLVTTTTFVVISQVGSGEGGVYAALALLT